MKRIILLVLAGLMVLVYYVSVFDNISGNLLRLHIISNSNSDYDTEIKLKVRDHLLETVSRYCDNNMSREDVLRLIPEIEDTANEFLEKNGISYSAKVRYETTDIPRKEYNEIVLPKGDYSAIRVILGEGGGENWWCVAYPPLCFTEEVFGGLSGDGERALKGMVGKDGYRVITSDIKYELKILEVSKKILKKIIG